jgi:hypothetical protein
MTAMNRMHNQPLDLAAYTDRLFQVVTGDDGQAHADRVKQIVSQPVTEDDIYELCEWLTCKDSKGLREQLANAANKATRMIDSREPLGASNLGLLMARMLESKREQMAIDKAINEECK